MCCFSPVDLPRSLWSRLFPPKPVKVADTRIFARLVGVEQLLAYSMQLSVRGDVAMILPLPVAPGGGDEALRFLDLSRAPDLFDRLELAFTPPAPAAARGGFGPRLAAPQAPRLVVHSVGAFEASYVPSIADFDRLDPRFRLPDTVWQKLPQVADYGFAVFKLKPGRGVRVHPMAFRFPTRDPGRLFFPTLHVHDGEVHAEADFDHALYFQSADSARKDAARAWATPAEFLDQEKVGELVDGQGALFKQALRGALPNQDTWLAA